MRPSYKVGLLAAFVSLLAGFGIVSPAYATGPYYFYAGKSQAAVSGGLSFNINTLDPGTVPSGDHSLMEITAQKVVGSKRQIVEMGWDKEPAVFGDNNIHMFVGVWVNDVFSGYNPASFVDNTSNAFNVGSTLSAGTTRRYAIIRSSNAWWIWYDPDGNGALAGDYVGYFPDTVWTGATPSVTTFTDTDQVQAFVEVASTTNSAPCTNGGSGIQGSLGAGSGAAAFASGSLVSGPAISMSPVVTNAAYYSVGNSTAATFYAGGPGAC
jgi:hypothetical protein